MSNKPTGDPILDALRAERERRGWSQTELGERLGRRSYNTAYNWECGVNEPKLSSLRAWARALGYDVTLTPLSAAQAKPTCTCPMIDVTIGGQAPSFVKGYDPACSACPNPYAEQDGADRG